MWFSRSEHRTLAVLLTCADWRLHQRKVNLNARIAKLLHVDGIDLIALPGPDGLLQQDRAIEWSAALKQIALLIEAHEPEVLAVAGHQRCAGHPVPDGAHDTDVRQIARALKAATGFPRPIHAMMLVYRSDSAWDIKPVAQF